MSKPDHERCGCVKALLHIACQLQLKLLLLLFPEFSNVLRDGDEVGQLPGFIPHGRDGLLRPVEFAGLLAVDDHAFEGGSLSELGPHLPIEFRIMQARFQNSRRLAQGFVSAVAGGCLKSWIHILDHALRVGEHYAVGCLLDDPRKQDKTLQRFPALGEIVEPSRLPQKPCPTGLSGATHLRESILPHEA